MPESIFSTYRGGENRVTSSILAVLRSLALSRMERLLGALMEQAEFELIRFKNQPKGDSGVPDAEITGSCRILIEAKIQRGAVDQEQLRRHLQCFDETSVTTQILLVLTPDDARPAAIDQLRDKRVVWGSFAGLDQAIEELLKDPSEVTSEREAFLLRELQTMLMEEGLGGFAKNVVVVAARLAWDEYLNCGAYVCQPGRPFQPVEYMAFYKDGQILSTVPRVVKVVDKLDLVKGKYEGRLADAIAIVLDSKSRPEGASQKIFLLTRPDDPQTKRLERPIKNTLRSANGRSVAFTQGQRYVSLDDLLKAASTADLV
jgi:hypothetical protein